MSADIKVERDLDNYIISGRFSGTFADLCQEIAAQEAAKTA